MAALPFAAAIFDMDGTLLATEQLAARAWPLAAQALALEFDTALPLAMIGHNAACCTKMITDRHGHDYPVAALMDATHRQLDALMAREGIALMPGALALVEWLSAAGLPMAVATSTRRARATLQLGNAGLLRHFCAVVGGDEVTQGKPAPDIYLEAAARLGVAPATCLALEDSAPGYRAAHAAGMTVVLVPDIADATAALAAFAPRVLPSLNAVQAWLACDNRRS